MGMIPSRVRRVCSVPAKRLANVCERYARDLGEGVNGAWWLPWQARWRVLRLRGGTVDAPAMIEPGVVFRYARTSLGRGVFINSGVIFDDGAGVTVGDNVAIAPGVRIITSGHLMGDRSRRAGEVFGEPVVIEDACWVGAGATILPGVTVARGCVVAAGAVVTKDTAPDGLYVGVPARRVRDLD